MASREPPGNCLIWKSTSSLNFSLLPLATPGAEAPSARASRGDGAARLAWRAPGPIISGEDLHRIITPARIRGKGSVPKREHDSQVRFLEYKVSLLEGEITRS